MLREKNLTPLRKKLLASARTFYTRLEGELQGQNDRASRAALARTYRSIARLTFEIDSVQGSLATYRQALTLQRALAAEEGAGPDATADLAELLLEMFDALGSQSMIAERDAAGSEALSLTRGLVERHPGVERYEAALAKSLTWQGIIFLGVGSSADALKAYQEAEPIYQRLFQVHPKNLAHLKGLAASTGGMGLALRQQGRVADGGAALKRSIALHEQLAQAEPGNALYQNAHAAACVNYGGGLGSSRSEETLVYLRKAQGIWERTLAEYPNSLFLQNNVGGIHKRIAEQLYVMGRPQEEAAAYERAAAAYERVAQSDPSTPRFTNEVADGQEILSLLYARAGRPSDALTAAQRAVAIREELARTHPDFQPERLWVCQLKLGDLQKAAGRGADARALYEKALAAYQKKAAAEGDKPTASTLRGLGVALQRLGKPAEAVTNLRRALALIQDSKSPDWVELALTRALLAGTAPEPGSGLTADEGESHAAEAVQALRRYVAGRHATVHEAVEAGYVDVNFVDKHYQLDSLRQRADFQQLLAETRAPVPTKRP
jgi:tetratricopeptide (TPR) repeat protein